MDKQVYMSTTSEGIYPSLYNIENGEKQRWGLFLAIIFSNFVLPGLLESYAIILSVRRDLGYGDWGLLVTPCVFCVTWSITEPLFREVIESRSSHVNTKRISIAGVFVSFVGVLLNVLSEKAFLHIFCFGFLGGLGTSVVLSQLNYVIADVSEKNINAVRLLSHYGRAIGQCSVPNIFLVIFHFYGHQMSYLLISAIVLQILPLAFFITTNQIKQPGTKANDRGYSFYGDNESLTNVTNNIPLVNLSKKNWKSPSDENLNMTQEEDDENDEYFQSFDPNNEELDDKNKNVFGVEILPQILEECESDEESDNIQDQQKSHINSTSQKQLEDDIKRLSVISNKLDEIIINTDNKEEPVDKIQNYKNEASDTHGDYWNSKRDTTQGSQNTLNSYSKRNSNIFSYLCCNCCASVFVCCKSKSKMNNALIYTSNSLVNPLKVSIITWQFYPALFLKTCSLCVPFCFSSLIALLGNFIEPKFHLADVACLLSVHGIAWLSFLIFSPRLNRIPKSKYKFVSAFGSITSALGSFVILDSRRFEFIALGCAIMGIGYGAISTSCEETLRNSIGPRKWPILRSTLDTLAGIFVTLIALWMSVLLASNNGVENCFGLLTAMLLISGLMWIMIPLAMTIRKHHDFEHMLPHV